MKLVLFPVLLCCVAAPGARGQVGQAEASGAGSWRGGSGGSGDYTVLERGPDRRVWGRVSAWTNELGQLKYQTNRYTELHSGITRRLGGRWVDASDRLEITDTGAAGTNGQHGVAFLGNLNSAGAVSITTPAGLRLATSILGLSYQDASGKSVFIGEVKDCTGQLLGSGHEVLYPDAFVGVSADVLYIPNPTR